MQARPADLKRPNAYALTVISATKTEGVRAGSTLYVDPDGEPAPGEWALIRCGAEVHAVEITAHHKSTVKFVQIFSRKPGELPRSAITEIHALRSISH